MDAKPQRPLRPLRARHDENAPVDSGKSIHQRYKSTGALPSILTAGGLKAAAKRTAFGDVSNTTRILPSTKDDGAPPLKNVLDLLEKPAGPEPEKKAAPLLRPAQRPLSLSGVKALLSNVSSVASAGSTAKQALSDPIAAAPLPHPRKPAAKRSTLVYQDGAAAEAATRAGPLQKESQSGLSNAPVYQSLAPRHHKSQPQLRDDAGGPGASQARHGRDHAHHRLPGGTEGVPTESSVAREAADLHLGSGVDQLLQAQLSAELGPTSEADGAAADDLGAAKVSATGDDDMAVYQMLHEQDRRLEAEARAKSDYASQLISVAELTEAEEYWEDELDEDIYDDEGYTTARSYPSRGDNTTGGPTTVLAPKVNAKVRKELAVAKEIVEASRTLDEVEEEQLDPTMVAEYGDEIFEYMQELEAKMLPDAHYMDNQAEIQWSMRSVLMEWIMQVHNRFNLLPETLFLCANYIDRFLSCKIVSLGKLQLVGATAIFIAAKYEEINCPSVHEIAYMVDGGYTVDEILKAERFMLSMLQFELGWPGPMSFLRRISKADDYDVEIRTLAKYFLEVAVMDERFVACPPSFVAAGAHCLARLLLKHDEWTPAHVHYSHYTYSQLRQVLSMLVECCEKPRQHHAVVYEKYSDRRFQRASLYCEDQMRLGFKLPESLGTVASGGGGGGGLVYEVGQAWRYEKQT